MPHLPRRLRDKPPQLTCSSCAHAKQRAQPHHRKIHTYDTAATYAVRYHPHREWATDTSSRQSTRSLDTSSYTSSRIGKISTIDSTKLSRMFAGSMAPQRRSLQPIMPKSIYQKQQKRSTKVLESFTKPPCRTLRNKTVLRREPTTHSSQLLAQHYTILASPQPLGGRHTRFSLQMQPHKTFAHRAPTIHRMVRHSPEDERHFYFRKVGKHPSPC